MKKFGLVGGVGYMSTLDYYKAINEGYKKRINSQSKSGEFPNMVIESLNLAVAYELVEKKDWAGFADLFITAIKTLKTAGVDFAAIAANTAHIVFDKIQEQSSIPIIGIVDATCKRAKEKNFKKLIVFGTIFTMNSGMYGKKCAQYGIEAIVPNETEQKIIQSIIFPNLEAGIVLENEKDTLLKIAKRMLSEYKADALVLGCTELPLAIKKDDLDIELLDTGIIHVDAILDYFFLQ
jgi:aspartate racemase